MTFTPKRVWRRTIRLRNYDYRQPGMYFLTINCWRKQQLFGQVRNGKMEINTWGEIVRQEWLLTQELRPYVRIDEFVVMPDHFHGLLQILPQEQNEIDTLHEDGWVGLQAPKKHSLGAILVQFKGAVTKRINAVEQTCGIRVWHSRYYDKIIRSEEELRNVRHYIKNNPVKWLK